MAEVVVLDASALVAAFRREAGSEAVARVIPGAAMNAVNVAEALIVLDRHGVPLEAAAGEIELLGLRVVPADADLAPAIARMSAATRRAGLSLGDCVCLATAKSLHASVLTADRAWGRLKVGVPITVLR